MVLRKLYHIKRKWPGQAGMAERNRPGQLAAQRAGEGSDMIAGSDEAGGLARGVVGSARTIAFGTSIVAPSASAATVLVLVVAFAGFASPLVVLITFAGAVLCAPAAGFLTGWMMIFAYALFVPAGVGLTRSDASRRSRC